MFVSVCSLHSFLGIILVEGSCFLLNLIGDFGNYVYTWPIPSFGKMGSPSVSNQNFGTYEGKAFYIVLVAFLKKSARILLMSKFLETTELVVNKIMRPKLS